MPQPATQPTPSLYTPEKLLHSFLRLFAPAHRRAAFLTAFLGGLACHLYILTNMLPEHDWQYNFYANQRKIMLGRWLLQTACAPSSDAILSWFTGLLVLLYLSLAAVLMVELLGLTSPVLAGLAGLLMVTVPSVASGFAYMFTADGYFLSVLAAVAAAFLCCRRGTVRKRVFCTVLSAVCLGCSMGIYQAYASVTLTLLCSVLVLRLVRDNLSFRNLFLDMVQMGAAVLGGVILYFVMMKLSILSSGQSLEDYQGISALSEGGAFSVGALLNRLYLIFNAWRNGLYYLLRDLPALCHSRWGFRFVWAMYVLLAVLLIACFIWRKSWRRVWVIPCCVIFLGLIPLGTNYVEVLTTEVSYHLLMRYSVVVPFLLVLALGQVLLESEGAPFAMRQAASAVVPVLCLLLCLCWTVLTNMGYTNMQYQYERVYSNMVRMADRIQQTAGFYNGIAVMISNSYAETLLDEDTIDVTGITGMGGISQYDAYHYISFMRTWCGLDIEGCDNDQVSAVWDSDAFHQMPVWPASGCTQVIGDVLVVKTAPSED